MEVGALWFLAVEIQLAEFILQYSISPTVLNQKQGPIPI